MPFCLVSKAALANTVNQYKWAGRPSSRYCNQKYVAAMQKLKQGISSITVFSKSSTLGINASRAVDSAAVQPPCNFSTVRYQKNNPNNANISMVSRAATTLVPNTRKEIPSKP